MEKKWTKDDMELAGTSVQLHKRGNFWTDKLATHSKNKNIAHLHTGISEFKKDEKGELLADTHILFELVEEIISFSYWMYIGSAVLGRWKYVSH